MLYLNRDGTHHVRYMHMHVHHLLGARVRAASSAAEHPRRLAKHSRWKIWLRSMAAPSQTSASFSSLQVTARGCPHKVQFVVAASAQTLPEKSKPVRWT